MTINSTNRKAGPYEGADSTGPFSFSFKVFQESDLLVVTADSNGVETTLEPSTDFTASINSDQDSNPGGTITLYEPLATGYTMIISSQVPYTQLTRLANQGGFYPEVITNALDKLTIEVQQLLEKQSRQLTYPITDPNTVYGDLPGAVDRANQYLAFDDAGNPISTLNIPEYIYQGVKESDPYERNSGAALVNGDMYFNSSSSLMRIYYDGSWYDVGIPNFTSFITETFSGDNSETEFTLSSALAYDYAIDVFISGVAQRYDIDFEVADDVLTFTSAPPAGTDNIYVKYMAAA